MGEYYYPVLFVKWTEKKHDGVMKRRVVWENGDSHIKFCDYTLVTKKKVMMFHAHGYKYDVIRFDGQVFSTFEGLKMMEHAHFGGRMMTHVLAEIEKYSRKPGVEINLVWMSDYASSNPTPTDGEYDLQHKYRVAQAIVCDYWLEHYRADPENIPKCSETGYIVNKDKNQYITVYNHRLGEEDEENTNICPLPLLTQFNEGGGGNYEGSNMDILGSWCLDNIQFQKKQPKEMECLDNMFRAE